MSTRTCSVEGCERVHLARGLCNMHYKRLQVQGLLEPVGTRICSVSDCDGIHCAKGYCEKHWKRLRRVSGGLNARTDYRLIPAERRLWSRLIDAANGCIEWTGVASSEGYGHIRVNGVSLGTHRLAWELVNGPIPEGMCVCHTCDNPPCCNVAHLFLGTKADNNRDRAAKGRNGAKPAALAMALADAAEVRHGVTR